MIALLIALALAQRQVIDLPQTPVMRPNSSQWLGKPQLTRAAIQPAPAGTSAVVLRLSETMSGWTGVENTGAQNRDGGVWDVGAVVSVDGHEIAPLRTFDYSPLPGNTWALDGELDYAGPCGRKWDVIGSMVWTLTITDADSIARFRRTWPDGLHHVAVVVTPRVGTCGDWLMSHGRWFRGDVVMDSAVLEIEYR